MTKHRGNKHSPWGTPKSRFYAQVSNVDPPGGLSCQHLLDFAVKLVEVCQILDPVKVQLCVLQDGLFVAPDKLLHVASHDFLVDMQPQGRPLKGLVGDLQVKWVPHGDGALQGALCSLFPDILWVCVSIVAAC